MDTTINQVNPVEYELEITATADDLAPEIKKALRAQQARTHMKGFRPGKVPLSLVKKMYGEALAYGIIDKSVQETYEETVLNAEEHDVLGQPKVTKLDYKLDGDLVAIVKFGVRPEVELQELAGEEVTKMVYDATEEDVDKEIEQIRKSRADLVPVEEGPAGEEDWVLFDLQEVDAESGAPVIGKRDEDQSIFLDDPRLENSLLFSELKTALTSAKIGDTVRFQFSHDKAHDDHEEGHDHAHHFEATLKEIKRRELPEVDDAFVKEMTSDRVEDVAAFREEIKKELDRTWEQRCRDYLEGSIIERMMELHEILVPESVVDVYLDAFIEDAKQRNQGNLPENFDEEAFREANRELAEKQARWMLIRDKVVDTSSLKVEDADYDTFFEEQAGTDGQLTVEQYRQFYKAMPHLMSQLEQRLISQKVFDTLADQFEMVEKDPDTIEREEKERQEAEEKAARAAEEGDTPWWKKVLPKLGKGGE